MLEIVRRFQANGSHSLSKWDNSAFAKRLINNWLSQHIKCMLLILFFKNVNQNTQMKESILILTLFLGSPLYGFCGRKC